MNPEAVQNVARECLGWRYAHNGRQAGEVDCFGLVAFMARRLGYALPDYLCPDESFGGTYAQFLETYHQFGEEVREAGPGVICVFTRAGNRLHMGMMIDPFRFIHAQNRVGVTVSRLDQPPWSRLKRAFYRMKVAA